MSDEPEKVVAMRDVLTIKAGSTVTYVCVAMEACEKYAKENGAALFVKNGPGGDMVISERIVQP